MNFKQYLCASLDTENISNGKGSQNNGKMRGRNLEKMLRNLLCRKLSRQLQACENGRREKGYCGCTTIRRKKLLYFVFNANSISVVK